MSPTPSVTPLTRSDASSAQPRANVAGELIDALHRDLRLMARHHLAREGRPHALEPTMLINEAYLRLARQRSLDRRNEKQFLALASTCMRRVLVDDARRRHACKRPQQPVEIVMEHHRIERPPVERTLSVRGALSHLRARNARQAVMVELRFFEGLSLDEIAAQLLVSPATVKRELRGGLEFLRRCLGSFCEV
jgi:RNA polymerase sigma-70 factor (ECF subfamily)